MKLCCSNNKLCCPEGSLGTGTIVGAVLGVTVGVNSPNVRSVIGPMKLCCPSKLCCTSKRCCSGEMSGDTVGTMGTAVGVVGVTKTGVGWLLIWLMGIQAS